MAGRIAFGNGLVPFVAVGEDRVDVEDHAAEIEQAMPHHLADAVAGTGHRVGVGCGRTVHGFNVIAAGAVTSRKPARRSGSFRVPMTSRPPEYAVDRLVFCPDDIDLGRSPLAGQLGMETYVLGAFNPGMTRLANGNLLMMVRVAEALREPIARRPGPRDPLGARDAIVLDGWPLELADTADPRKFLLRGGGWKVMALTSLSWLLPVELTPDGLEVVAIHYDKAIAPEGTWQCYGVEDARISQVDGRMADDDLLGQPGAAFDHALPLRTIALDWRFEGIVLDHQNKDMLIFEGLIGGQYWAQTRPLGDLYFAYPPGSEWRAGPVDQPRHLARRAALEAHASKPGIRPHAGTVATARIGGGTPPILTDRSGWLTLWHGVEPSGDRRHLPHLLVAARSRRSVEGPRAPTTRRCSRPIPTLTAPLEEQMYVRDVVFTTGIADAGDHFIVASGEADLACRITHVPKAAFA